MRIMVLTLLATAASYAGPILYTIGADANGVPNQLVRIDTNTQTVTSLTTLGSGASSYGGGIATDVGNSQFYGFESNSNGDVSLVTYNASGVISPLAAVGTLSPGGLAIGPGTGYFNANGSAGDWSLYRLSPLMMLLGDTGATANGLAFDSNTSNMYTILNDSSGNSIFYGYNLVTAVVVANSPIGSGFYGGLARDPATGRFYLIGSDGVGPYKLFAYAPGDPSPTELFSLGSQGFAFSGLTVGDDTSGVPEPGTWVVGCGAVAMLFRRKV